MFKIRRFYDSGGFKKSWLKIFKSGTIAYMCPHCYNIIYNSVPYSLLLKQKEIEKIAADVLRYDFTMESDVECRAVLSGENFPFAEYTTGHLKRGIE